MAKKPVVRLSKSLDTLRSQVNALAPKRKKASDGWLGDAKHSMRKSDHNPEPDGTVDALDITHDPAGGVDIQKLCDAIIKSKDRRVSYLICNGKIIAGNGGVKPWIKRPYSGANKHTQHLHVSIKDEYQDDTAPWKIEAAFGKTAPAAKPVTPAKPVAPAKPKIDIYDGKFHDEVKFVQTRLDELGYPEVGTLDGKWGNRTRGVVLTFRADNDLPLVPLIDNTLLTAMAKAEPRIIAPARKDATMSDLRADGAKDVKAADATQVAGTIVAGGGIVAGAEPAVKAAEGYGGLIKRIADIVEPVQQFVTDNLWLLVIGGGALIVWQTGVLKKLRLWKHRTGKDVSE